MTFHEKRWKMVDELWNIFHCGKSLLFFSLSNVTMGWCCFPYYFLLIICLACGSSSFQRRGGGWMLNLFLFVCVCESVYVCKLVSDTNNERNEICFVSNNKSTAAPYISYGAHDDTSNVIENLSYASDLFGVVQCSSRSSQMEKDEMRAAKKKNREKLLNISWHGYTTRQPTVMTDEIHHRQPADLRWIQVFFLLFFFHEIYNSRKLYKKVELLACKIQWKQLVENGYFSFFYFSSFRLYFFFILSLKSLFAVLPVPHEHHDIYCNNLFKTYLNFFHESSCFHSRKVVLLLWCDCLFMFFFLFLLVVGFEFRFLMFPCAHCHCHRLGQFYG